MEYLSSNNVCIRSEVALLFICAIFSLEVDCLLFLFCFWFLRIESWGFKVCFVFFFVFLFCEVPLSAIGRQRLPCVLWITVFLISSIWVLECSHFNCSYFPSSVCNLTLSVMYNFLSIGSYPISTFLIVVIVFIEVYIIFWFWFVVMNIFFICFSFLFFLCFPEDSVSSSSIIIWSLFETWIFVMLPWLFLPCLLVTCLFLSSITTRSRLIFSCVVIWIYLFVRTLLIVLVSIICF